MLAATLHMMEGTPYIYQGEELGMTNIDFSSIHDYRDLDTLNAWHELVDQQHALTSEDMLKRIHRRSRDNARTPMQWDATQHAGFTKSTPWIKVNPNYQTINAAAELADPDSVFFFYQSSISCASNTQLSLSMVIMSYWIQTTQMSLCIGVLPMIKSCSLSTTSPIQEQSRPISTRLPKNARLMISNYADDRGDVLRPYETRSYLGERR